MAATVVGAGPVAAVGAATRATTAATLSASPDTNLRDGQAVTVTGAGYPAGVTTDLLECELNVSCDFTNIALQQTDSNGGYTTTYAARRILQFEDGTTVDCAAAQDCILLSLDITDLSGGAQTPITFDPNSPIIPPLHFRVIPDRNDHVQVAKGVARVTGTVECNRPADISADILLTQIYKQSIFQSEVFIDIPCDHGGHWSAVFRPQNGLFGAGAAKVRVDAFGFTTTQYEQLKTTAITLVAQS